jgi:hypothetical protein
MSSHQQKQPVLFFSDWAGTLLVSAAEKTSGAYTGRITRARTRTRAGYLAIVGDRHPRSKFQGSTFVRRPVIAALNVRSLHAAMRITRSFRPTLLRLAHSARSLLHRHAECDDLTASIRQLSMRLDYVVGREAARRRKTRQAADCLLFLPCSFFLSS